MKELMFTTSFAEAMPVPLFLHSSLHFFTPLLHAPELIL